MNSFAHLLVGKLLHTYLDTKYGVMLDRAGFLYGNYLPDFTWRFKQVPHEAAYWETYLKNEISALMELNPDTRYGRQYSKRLGIICHFYADFFCHAHTAAFCGGSYPHIRYEWTQYRLLRRNYADLSRTDFSPATISAGPDSVYAGFEKLHREYLGLEPMLINDITYTLSACAEATARITAGSAADWVTEDGSLACDPSEA